MDNLPKVVSIHSVLIAPDSNKSFCIPITIEGKEIVETSALLDTGAGGKFIDQNYARRLKLELKDLEESIKVRNVDGTLNKKGTVSKYAEVKLTINGRTKTQRLLITGLGRERIILGLPWFREENLDIDWKK